VDDAIVVLENVHRRSEMGEPPLVAAVKGSHEIGFAVIATRLTLAAVFVPISFLPGDLGRLFREFGFTLAASVLFSALVALTLTPMLASKLPHDAHERGRLSRGIDRLFKAISGFYSVRLRWLVTRPWIAICGVLVLVGLGIVTFRSVPAEFAPTADLGRAYIQIEGPEGSSFDYIDGYATELESLAFEQMERGDIARVVLRVPGQGGANIRTG